MEVPEHSCQAHESISDSKCTGYHERKSSRAVVLKLDYLASIRTPARGVTTESYSLDNPYSVSTRTPTRGVTVKLYIFLQLPCLLMHFSRCNPQKNSPHPNFVANKCANLMNGQQALQVRRALNA